MENNQKIDEILDCCVDRLRKGESIEEILTNYHEEYNNIKSHLEIAQSLFQMKHPEPEGSAIDRTIYKIGLEHGLKKVNRIKTGRFRTILAWAASIIIIIMTGSYATANLADKSNPGDLLYPVKLATEKMQLALVRSPQGEVEMRITLSERRLHEIIASSEQGHLHEAVLVEMLEEAKKAVYDINKLKGMNRRIMIEKVKALCATQQVFLKELITIRPVKDYEQIQQAIKASEDCMKKCCEIGSTKPQKCNKN